MLYVNYDLKLSTVSKATYRLWMQYVNKYIQLNNEYVLQIEIYYL